MACVTFVLRWHGYRVSYRSVLDELSPSVLDGVDPRTIESVLRRRGLSVASGNWTRGDVQHFTRSDRPVIACVPDHWVVVAGLRRGRVSLMDPIHGIASEHWSEFAARWLDSDRFGGVYRAFGIVAWGGGDNGTAAK